MNINPDQVCPDCFRTMDIVNTESTGTSCRESFVCPVCDPDPFDREEDRRMDVMDMAQEMRRGMDDE